MIECSDKLLRFLHLSVVEVVGLLPNSAGPLVLCKGHTVSLLHFLQQHILEIL